MAVASRTLSNLEKVVGEIEALGGRSIAIVTDVSVSEQVRNMVEKTMEQFGKVDILVNNAAIVHRTPLLEITEEEWDEILSVNLKGNFLCTQAIAKHMVERKYGKIINISSVTGRGGGSIWMGHYTASKAGIISLTKSYAKELGPYGINVNAIAPGAIDTDQPRRGRTPEQIQQFLEYAAKSAIIGRIGTAQDIANLALFLASDEASFICGETIAIDGGRLRL